MSVIDQAFAHLVDLVEYLGGDKRINITCADDHYHFGVKSDGTLLRYLDEQEKVGLETDIGLIKMALFEGMQGAGAIIVRQYNASTIQLGEFTVVIDHVCGARLAENGIRPLSGEEMLKAYKTVPEATQFIDMPTRHALKQHFAKLDDSTANKSE
ncbi:MAG: hypothetical protein ACPG4U_11940 [Pseudomonadales bacterium]